jgi:hypothetical protein
MHYQDESHSPEHRKCKNISNDRTATSVACTNMFVAITIIIKWVRKINPMITFLDIVVSLFLFFVSFEHFFV